MLCSRHQGRPVGISTESEGQEMGDAGLCGLLISSSDLIFLQRARRDGVRAAHQANTIAYNLWKADGPPHCRSTTGHVVLQFCVGQSCFCSLPTQCSKEKLIHGSLGEGRTWTRKSMSYGIRWTCVHMYVCLGTDGGKAEDLSFRTREEMQVGPDVERWVMDNRGGEGRAMLTESYCMPGTLQRLLQFIDLSHNNLGMGAIISILRMKTWGSETLGDFSKPTRLTSSRAGICTWVASREGKGVRADGRTESVLLFH